MKHQLQQRSVNSTWVLESNYSQFLESTKNASFYKAITYMCFIEELRGSYALSTLIFSKTWKGRHLRLLYITIQNLVVLQLCLLRNLRLAGYGIFLQCSARFMLPPETLWQSFASKCPKWVTQDTWVRGSDLLLTFFRGGGVNMAIIGFDFPQGLSSTACSVPCNALGGGCVNILYVTSGHLFSPVLLQWKD